MPLRTALAALPGDFPAAVLVVQHRSAARRLPQYLNDRIVLPVREAAEGDALRPGEVLVAPVGVHLTVDARRRVCLLASAPVRFVRPSDPYETSRVTHHGLRTGLDVRRSAGGIVPTFRGGGGSLDGGEHAAAVAVPEDRCRPHVPCLSPAVDRSRPAAVSRVAGGAICCAMPHAIQRPK